MTRRELTWLGTTAMVLATVATVAARPAALLVWNVSPSAPEGLYIVQANSEPVRGGMAVARLPLRWRRLAARRGYIPVNVPLVKRVAAVGGDRVCATASEIRIDGRFAAWRLANDPRGRLLPAWHGCVTLKAHELFLLNGRRDSFDGRYFGVTQPDELIGSARLLWRI